MPPRSADDIVGLSIKKLTKRLRREMAASPKKAAALGLLLLVATYYWMPLFRGMVVKGDLASSGKPAQKDDLPETQFDSITLEQAALQPAAPAKQGKPTYDWHKVAGWMEEDAATRPAPLTKRTMTRPSPFQPVVAEVAQSEPPKEVEEPVEPVLTPDSLGMKLSATVVGPGRSVAVIGGRAYAKGQSVESVKGGEVIEFKLSEVLSQRIVLERQGQHFELAMPERPTSGGIELKGKR